MGLLLRVRGVVCLHASAVAINRRAIVFVGDAGAGKSTTAMAMGRLGYPIISDDIVPIYEDAGVTYAQPGYPRMRLRQPSLPMLSNLNPDLPPLPKVEGEGRLHFELTSSGYQFQSDPLADRRALCACGSKRGSECAPCGSRVAPGRHHGYCGQYLCHPLSRQIHAGAGASRAEPPCESGGRAQAVSHTESLPASQCSARSSWKISVATIQKR